MENMAILTKRKNWSYLVNGMLPGVFVMAWLLSKMKQGNGGS